MHEVMNYKTKLKIILEATHPLPGRICSFKSSTKPILYGEGKPW
jgi:hypothetical protein